MRIIFMGTPEFAVLCLERIVQQGHEILAVFTQPDKLFGRKQVLKCSPVKIKAESFNFPIKQPEKLDEAFIDITGTEKLFGDFKEALSQVKECKVSLVDYIQESKFDID